MATLIDQYSALDHKLGMEGSGAVTAAPSWASPQDVRRLNAYYVLGGYYENAARVFLDDDDEDKKNSWREYGDPWTIAQRISAGILGSNPNIGIVGADVALPPEPKLGPAPRPPEDGLEGLELQVRQRSFDIALQQWAIRADIEIERWTALSMRLPALVARQEWLRRWAEQDQYVAKLRELEAEAIVPLGDGILVHGWDAEHSRPDTSVWRPEAYFPELSADTVDRFPDRVHLAYTFTEEIDGEETELVRRVTYELEPIDESAADIGSRPLYLEDGDEWRFSCLFSDGTWLAEDVEDIYNIRTRPLRTGTLDVGEAEPVPAIRIPLGLDFIPVVHLTHNHARFNHFGRSPLTPLAMLFDEIAGSDTDESLASSWAARPPIILSGLPAGQSSIEFSPGVGVGIEVGGKAETVEMAPNLSELMKRTNELRTTGSVNGAVPAGILGRVDPTKVVSGYLLEVSFTPYFQTINGARDARRSKWALSGKMVQRIAIQNGDKSLGGSTEVFPSEFRPGQFMPRDAVAVAELITALGQSDAASQRTRIAMAQKVVPEIEDVDLELAAARQTMTADGKRMTEALDDPGFALEFMGLGRRSHSRDDSSESGGVVSNPESNGVSSPVTQP